ncbi:MULTISPECIES: LacI family DNA-binding transcriptional regulator [Pseudonocardia]|uniref:HTH-type transcriptional regulator DegA n=2 Tax=Pseudonocardia TaxID=1847 RepID=A0A1Y2N789_PSEAH|nr:MULTISPECIES: LacI family DNA-binding transcriptional regulator [Pseudonocardia]OSY42758.1 HTH-type transcriptional regulator DegA [Pseudonocardia autotrophica]TDN77335.1 LacI family transcriptional regulator [Pseudonocardia autotrophica]BBG01357.1 LacI family transcriptional regulator [Pseudonocardia autotrophica]GEC24413.1 LacI family transcriptional regulator [Pseudonocardia saturnea]
MAPTLTDVARTAGVALSTASRVFSDPERIGARTRHKVLTAAQELGYTPRVVEPVVAPHTSTVAAVVPDIANPVFSRFVKAAQAQGRQVRSTVVVADTDYDAEREREVIADLRARVDGIVVHSSRLEGAEVLELCGATPSVLVNREIPGGHCVIADSTQGLRQVVDHLDALAHKHIAYVQGRSDSWSNLHRIGLVRDLAAEYGCELSLLGWHTETTDGGSAAAARVLASGATAAIAHNDLVALGLMAGARSLGARVPDDLSVVGSDDIPFAALSEPGLSSIATPMDRAGTLAMEILGRAAAGERTAPRAVRLSTHFVARGTTGPAPARSATALEVTP